IRAKWLEFLPTLEAPGSRPISALSDFASLVGILPHVPDDGEERREIPGLRQEVFREAIFLLHKASSVVGAAQKQVKSGMLTWALSDAYRGAFFALKALFGILGIFFVGVGDRHYMIDIWPGPKKGERQRRRRGSDLGAEMQFVRMPGMQHRE